MVKPPKKPKVDEIETEPDGWDRFQRTMDKIIPPKQRAGKTGGGGAPMAIKPGKRKTGLDGP